MTLIRTECLLSEVEAIREHADQANKGEVRLQLTGMLRCAGKLGCDQAVECSDQAMDLLRRLVLPESP